MKNIKAILWDMDGVILMGGYAFSQHLQKHYHVRQDELLDFFNGDFKETSVGRKDLKDILEARLVGWNWKLGINNFMRLWFLLEAKTDDRVLEVMKIFKDKGVITCLATNQEKYRKQFLLEEVGLQDVIDRGFFSCDLGVCKPDPVFYEKVLEKLGLEAPEVLVIDDDEKNVEGAKTIGMQGIYYEGFESLRSSGLEVFKD